MGSKFYGNIKRLTTAKRYGKVLGIPASYFRGSGFKYRLEDCLFCLTFYLNRVPPDKCQDTIVH